MKSYLNLGCGSRFHPAWTNVDFVARGNFVIGYDLRKGIPFPNDQFDVVYHSHLLEHFSKAETYPFLRECYRVLKPGGIIRIAVPDLERIVRVYLQALEEAAQGNEQWQHHYEWITLELYDQTVREQSGGEMAKYLKQEVIPNEKFVLERIGLEGQHIIKSKKRHETTSARVVRQSTLVHLLHLLYRFLRDHASLRESLIKHILGAEYELLQLGRFRRGGEVHLWMYDRYSLAQLLKQTGFQNPRSFSPTESQILGWTDYNLDTEPDGIIYKPDSMYMEAVKPLNLPLHQHGKTKYEYSSHKYIR